MRGGRRPGSGAPKGNTNALKTGAYSRRARRVYEDLQRLAARHDEPALRALFQTAIDAGIFRTLQLEELFYRQSSLSDDRGDRPLRQIARVHRHSGPSLGLRLPPDLMAALALSVKHKARTPELADHV